MAAGPVTVLNIAREKIGEGVINLESNDFRVVLATSAQAIDATFLGTSGDARYSDLTAELVGAGYTAGGAELENSTWARSGGTVTFAADPTTWLSLTGEFKYGIIRKDGGNNDILAFFDVETLDPDGRSVTAADFVVNWTGGLFTLTQAA